MLGRLALAIPLFLLLPTAAAAQADYIVHNARIYTMDQDLPEAQALAVRGDRILMVGSDPQVLAAYSGAPRIDAAGRTIVPGFIDAHAHLMGQGMSLMQADLVGTESIKDILARLKEFEQRLPEGAWLTGRGWDQNDWPTQTFPTRADLDEAFPDRPVWLERIDGHASWANTAALELAGLEEIRNSDNPPGGEIVRDASGEPTGVFIDEATRLVGRHVPDPSEAERLQALRLALAETARYGLTGVHDAGVGMRDIQLYRRAAGEGWFTLRLYGMISGRGETFDRICEEGPIFENRLTVRSVKFYIDGALGSRGAALIEPYSDAPETSGLLQTTPDAFTGDVKAAFACGFQVNTHAIGDRGNRVALDAYEAALESVGPSVGRHRIEHAQIVHPDDIPRFAQLGVIAAMQPTHATSDMYWAEDRVGHDRIEGAYAWRSFIEKGVPLAFGSDFPVEKVNPMLGFYAAITRQDAEGYPEGGWLPNQRLTREEALHAFTLGAAYAAFQEDELGSLEPGKLADFVVLSGNIMSIPAPEILETDVVATYLGGEPVHHVDGWAPERSE